MNLFDLGIVLAVAFLLVALSSLQIAQRSADRSGGDQIKVRPKEQVRPVKTRGERVAGRGQAVGTVYRLRNGDLVYVTRPRK